MFVEFDFLLDSELDLIRGVWSIVINVMRGFVGWVMMIDYFYDYEKKRI